MKNKIKLGLINFQSISDGELEFETGLNFIVGQSNSGKSATFRALKACLSNPPGSQRFIKKGTNYAEVELEYNGNTITWKRTKGESSYVINGETYVKTGKSDAFKILEDTGFAKDHNDVIMNIEEELQLPFPYGISKTDLFKLFENVFCVSDSAVILKSAKDHENVVKAEVEILENEVLKTNKKLEELAKFKKELNLNDLKAKRELLIQQQSKLENLTEGTEVIKRAVEVAKIKMSKPITFADKMIAYNDIMRIQVLVNQLEQFHKMSKTLKSINIPAKIDIRDYQEALAVQKELRKLQELLKLNVKVPLNSKDINLKRYEDLCSLRTNISALQELLNLKLPKFEIEEKLTEYQSLIDYKEEIEKIRVAGKQASEKKKQIMAKLAGIQQQLKQFKVCPLCHRPLNTEEN